MCGDRADCRGIAYSESGDSSQQALVVGLQDLTVREESQTFLFKFQAGARSDGASCCASPAIPERVGRIAGFEGPGTCEFRVIHRGCAGSAGPVP